MFATCAGAAASPQARAGVAGTDDGRTARDPGTPGELPQPPRGALESFPGHLETAVAGWLGAFPAEFASPREGHLTSVEAAGCAALSVKVPRGVALDRGRGTACRPGNPQSGGTPPPATAWVLAEVVLSC